MSAQAFCPRCGKKLLAVKTVTVDLDTGKPVRKLRAAYLALLAAAGLAVLVVWILVITFPYILAIWFRLTLLISLLISMGAAAGGWGLKVITQHQRANFGVYNKFRCKNCKYGWNQLEQGEGVYQGIQQDWTLRKLEGATPGSDARRAAIQALGRSGDAKSIEPLIAVLRDEGFGKEADQAAAAEALGAIGDPRAVGPLVEALSGPRMVRISAATSLGCFGSRATAALVCAMGDQDWQVRRAAAESLGGIGDPEAIAALQRALSDPHARVRAAAEEAL